VSTTAQTLEPQPATADAGARHLVDLVVRVREVGIIVALALVVGVTAAGNSRFLSAQSIRDLLLNASVIALLAVGQTMVVVARHIDLSVGSVLGLVAFMTGDLFLTHPGVNPLVVTLLGVLVGAGWGVVHGVLVSLGRVPSLVITLGTLYLIRGIDYAWAQGRQINAANLPSGFLTFGSGNVAGAPYLVLITVAVVVMIGYYLRRYRSGRELYAIGSNPAAAVLAGVPVTRRVFWAFVCSGALAGLAGVLWTARFGTVDATAGTGYELAVVAAVVVGGVGIFGGTGSVYGAALGALLLSTIGSALVVLRVPSFWEQAIDGALLLTAISLDRYIGLRVARLMRKRSPHHG